MTGVMVFCTVIAELGGERPGSAFFTLEQFTSLDLFLIKQLNRFSYLIADRRSFRSSIDCWLSRPNALSNGALRESERDQFLQHLLNGHFTRRCVNELKE